MIRKKFQVLKIEIDTIKEEVTEIVDDCIKVKIDSQK